MPRAPEIPGNPLSLHAGFCCRGITGASNTRARRALATQGEMGSTDAPVGSCRSFSISCAKKIVKRFCKKKIKLQGSRKRNRENPWPGRKPLPSPGRGTAALVSRRVPLPRQQEQPMPARCRCRRDADAGAVPVPALPSLLPVPGPAAGEPGVTRAMPDGRAHLGPGRSVWHLASSEAAAGGVEPVSPPTPGHESVAGGGGDESGAAEGTRRRRHADTPGGLVSDSSPHPGEDKEPEQEFDCRLVSRQGIVTPASSGMRTAHGKLPARSPEAPGAPHLPTRGAAAPHLAHPQGCSVLASAPSAPSSPVAFPTALPSPRLQTGSSLTQPSYSWYF